MKTPRQTISAIIRAAIDHGVKNGKFPVEASSVSFSVDLPKNPDHGDLATNAAFALAPVIKSKPPEVAEKLAALCREVDSEGVLSGCQTAKPAFINFRFSDAYLAGGVSSVYSEGRSFGRLDDGGGRKVMVEFVSANPTGPLHVGHGRGAVVGDVVASILDACGYAAWREFYVNDAGAQVRNLGLSLKERIKEKLGRPFELPKDGYHGEYVRELADDLLKEHGPEAAEIDDAELSLYGSKRLLKAIQDDLLDFGVKFDEWYPESRLHQGEGKVAGIISDLKARGLAFDDPSGAVMLRADAGKEFGDDKDRVLVKSSGDTTYFASDIAYHDDKFKRGFSWLINVWGADHHGYIPRVRAGIKALGHDPQALDVILVQMVNVLRDGKQITMSKRSGSFVTLREVYDEVGRDAARIVFCIRKPDAQLDFDIDLVKRRTMDNPVFYVQYGHARICSILRKAAEAGYPEPSFSPDLMDHLKLPEEREMAKKLLFYPDILLGCARTLEPHHLVYYINDLIGVFHGYYTKYKGAEKVISDDAIKTRARLMLCGAMKTVLGNAMAVLGVSAPERMDNIQEEEQT
jgi:arginyl-tRNA synthetase